MAAEEAQRERERNHHRQLWVALMAGAPLQPCTFEEDIILILGLMSTLQFKAMHAVPGVDGKRLGCAIAASHIPYVKI